MLVTKTKVLPIEAIVRGHLAGSAWSTYESIGKVNNIEMAKSYKKYDKFKEPIFTPSTKAEIGDKDENISIEQMQGIIGVDLTEKIQRISIELFKFAYNFAKKDKARLSAPPETATIKLLLIFKSFSNLL